MRTFGLDHAEQVMRALPTHLSTSSRRQVAQLVNRVASLAVYPLRLMPAHPLPRGGMPKVRPEDQRPQAKPFPDEADRLTALAGNAKAPFGLRLLVGFIAREGMRHEEAETLSWGNVDLERGLVQPSKNKTDDDAKSWLESGLKPLGDLDQLLGFVVTTPDPGAGNAGSAIGNGGPKAGSAGANGSEQASNYLGKGQVAPDENDPASLLIRWSGVRVPVDPPPRNQ